MNQPQLRITDGADIADDADDADLIVLTFSRKDVDTLSVTTALNWLLPLSEKADLAAKLEGRITFLFEGYDDDTREIYEIPQCRAFLRRLNVYWPYWYHFLEKENDSFKLLFQLLCDTQKVITRGHMVASSFDDINQVKRVALSLFTALNTLYVIHAYSKEQIAAMNAKVIAAYNEIFPY